MTRRWIVFAVVVLAYGAAAAFTSGVMRAGGWHAQAIFLPYVLAGGAVTGRPLGKYMAKGRRP